MLTRAFHAQVLPEGLPEWIHLIPAGEIPTRDGRGPYVNGNPEGIVSEFQGYGMPLPIDYEHQSLEAIEKTGPVPGAGWIHELDNRGGEIWGRVEWTERAAGLISAKEYLYISPVYIYEPKTGVIIRLVGAGLTNNPNLYLQAVACQGGVVNDLLERLCYMLNLPVLSTPEDITTHLTRLIEMVQGNAAAVQSMAVVLGLPEPEKAELAVVSQALARRIQAEPDMTRFVSLEDHERATQALSALQAQRTTEETERVVGDAIRDGKIAPAMRQWAIDLCTQNKESFQAYLSKAPVVASGEAKVPGGAPQTVQIDLSDPHAIAAAAQEFQRKEKESGREISVAQAVAAVTGKKSQ